MTLKDRLPLLHQGREPLAGVLGREEAVLKLPFEGEALL